MNDFEPTTAERNTSNGWRLLILNGHNLHCTPSFMQFCEHKQILVLCLPSHTTHWLQPCDVGVFRPLAATWKAKVNAMGWQYTKIMKYNLLKIYHEVHQDSLTPPTIHTAFRKTGIWPFDPMVIPDIAFEPALNTTTQAAQPVPTVLLHLLEPISSSPTLPTSHSELPLRTNHKSHKPTSISASMSAQSIDSTITEDIPTPSPTFQLANFPPCIAHYASCEMLSKENTTLRTYCHEAKGQIEADCVSKQLMDTENEQLRARLFNKSQKPTKRKEGGSSAHHMTGTENMITLAKCLWQGWMNDVHKEIVER